MRLNYVGGQVRNTSVILRVAGENIAGNIVGIIVDSDRVATPSSQIQALKDLIC
jgi:hypothetical protein